MYSRPTLHLDSFRCILVTGKNVAADIADKLCESIRTKLEGRVLGTFTSKSSSFGYVLAMLNNNVE